MVPSGLPAGSLAGGLFHSSHLTVDHACHRTRVTAGVQRAPSRSRATGFALLAACVFPGSAIAQTGLLVAAPQGVEQWNTALHEAVAEVRWAPGPVGLVFLGRGDAAARDWGNALDALARRGARTVVVVPMPQVDAEGFFALLEGLPGRDTLRVAAPPPELSPFGVARWIEYGAGAALAGRVEGMGGRPLYRLPPLNVTATRTMRTTFGTPFSVSVLGRDAIMTQTSSGVADLFRDVPGLDVEGVGANQRRPAIRGLLGQRILLLADGLRLNNTRRRQDSGETPALVDPADIERIEVVRGAASVLYGSDAVGGVVNLIELTPGAATAEAPVRTRVGVRYRTVDRQVNPSGSMTARIGRLAVRLAGSYRHADPYSAPGGTFGTVTLDSTTRVEDTGVQDHSGAVTVAYQVAPQHELYAKHERYWANDAGFGFVDPAVLGDGLPRVQLLFPEQRFTRSTVRYQGANLDLLALDRLAVAVYWQQNDRQFDTNVFSPLGPTAPPGAGVLVESRSFTDLDTYGFRVEAQRVLGGGHVLTYGVDLFRDRAQGTDSTRTTVTIVGPPTVTDRTNPRVPTATFRSLGAFVQAEVNLAHQATLVLGMRYQDVRTATRPTPGVTEPLVDATDRTLVGAANLLVRLRSDVNVVASAGRAFRSPNLVERFFSGSSPEGRGVWIRNPALEPEKSLNLELGLRYRGSVVEADAFVFRNTIFDGIQITPTGQTVNGVPEFQNRNVEELRYTGIELTATVALWRGLSLRGDFTRLATRNVTDPDEPLGEGYPHRIRGVLRYDGPRNRLWGEYVVRHHGRRDSADLGTSPILPYVPPFTVHTVRGGVIIRRGLRLGLAVENLTNALYAEATNVGFFRPEPKRSVALTSSVEF